eukprot:CAMPEP_0177511464 /NCGR_PEP_ID=MMETSP0369-20130122/42692_1 /TAXON_ID=447022 ORGANISM="Scrippsiella hangoei-like, Strain SHHI-4" /NCGR_SAMPLE_ID=MMETSP0369 /ASSEMBLY_ACC=CAM_ASM_000364 /LENGTH=233 /DNA_ID=CAMNT_0018989879 /DNA_START=183 /DNA_END=886 /DNA_ORIENTATION=+
MKWPDVKPRGSQAFAQRCRGVEACQPPPRSPMRLRAAAALQQRRSTASETVAASAVAVAGGRPCEQHVATIVAHGGIPVADRESPAAEQPARGETPSLEAVADGPASNTVNFRPLCPNCKAFTSPSTTFRTSGAATAATPETGVATKYAGGAKCAATMAARADSHRHCSLDAVHAGLPEPGDIRKRGLNCHLPADAFPDAARGFADTHGANDASLLRLASGWALIEHTGFCRG